MPTQVLARVGGENGLLRKFGGADSLANAIDSYFRGTNGHNSAATFLTRHGFSSRASDMDEGGAIITTVRRLLGHNIESSPTSDSSTTVDIGAGLKDAIEKALRRRRCLDAVEARQRGTGVLATDVAVNPVAPPGNNDSAALTMPSFTASEARAQLPGVSTTDWSSLWSELQKQGWTRIPCFGTSSFKFKRPDCSQLLTQEEVTAYVRNNHTDSQSVTRPVIDQRRNHYHQGDSTSTATSNTNNTSNVGSNHDAPDAGSIQKSLDNLDRATKSLLNSSCINTSDKWADVIWKLKKQQGWKEIKGSGLNSFVYINPYSSKSIKTGLRGVDWFSEDELRAYAEKSLGWKGNKIYIDRSARAARRTSSSAPVPTHPPPNKIPTKRKGKRKRSDTSVASKASGAKKKKQVKTEVKAEKGIKANAGDDCFLKSCNVQLKDRIKELQGKKEALIRALPYQKDVSKEKRYLIKTVRERACKNLPKIKLPNTSRTKKKSAVERRNARLKASIKQHESDLRGLLTLLPTEKDMKKGREHLIKAIHDVSEFEPMFDS